MIIEYDIYVPNHWDAHDVESYRNDGGWCVDNALEELEDIAENGGCLCDRTRYEYIEDVSGPELREN